MKKNFTPDYLPVTLSILRVLTGWHFLYEGIIKLGSGNWSSYYYLSQSRWVMSDFFHWIMSNSTALAITDFINIWGLMFIGTALFLGIFVRLASVGGILLLLLYYIAVPPFIVPAGGYFYLINYQILEAGVLFIFIMVDKDYMFGIEKLLKVYFQKKKEEKFPLTENHELSSKNYKRREF